VQSSVQSAPGHHARPADAGRSRSALRGLVGPVALGAFVLAVIVAGHVALDGGWIEWGLAPPVALRAFAAATAFGIGVVQLAAYRGRRRPAALLVGMAFLGVGIIKATRVAVVLVGEQLGATELYSVSVRMGWAQSVFLPVVLVLGMLLVSPQVRRRGEQAWPRVVFVLLSVALIAVATVGSWHPAFPGDIVSPSVASRPDAAWAIAAHLFLLSMLWRRPDVSATAEGRWLTFAMYVALLNQLLVAPFWTVGSPAGASTLNAFLKLVTFVIVGCGVAVGMVAMARSEAAAADRERERQAEQQRIEAALARQAARLTHANEELAQYAYLASHDLQEPLRMVTSYLQLIERRYHGVLDEEGREFMRFAVDGAVRMKRLTNDLLLYSQVSARPVEPAETDAGEAFAVARANLAVAIRETNASVTSDPLPPVPMAPVEIVQLLQNLIANALKFRREGVDPSVHLSAERHGDELLFALADNGIGIEAQHHERVFGVFQRLHPVDSIPGSGIGLALCRKIVERHGGSIWFESTVGEGTTFRWTIPVTVAAPSEAVGEGVDAELEERVTSLIDRAREIA
jgi:signal transduction histidine kinase